MDDFHQTSASLFPDDPYEIMICTLCLVYLVVGTEILYSDEEKKLGQKMKKVERKKEEKGLKNASFWVINSKKEGKGKIIRMHNIYPCITVT